MESVLRSPDAPALDLGPLLDLESRVVFLPVRHHSPACARMVADMIHRLQPSAVLIEGPSDYNEHLDQLRLPHRLPIAIYSYVTMEDGRRRGAYYPFCEHSPEWQALLAAREVGASAAFIDLPWAEIIADDDAEHRYADAHLGHGRYIRALCRQLGVDDFHAAWDRLFEAPPSDTFETFRRCHTFCAHLRLTDQGVSAADRRREAFMVEWIRGAMEEAPRQVVVVSGGYHSSALHARLVGRPWPGLDDAPSRESSPKVAAMGISLTPYSYERLDSLTGYDAGMPNPGFYEAIWQDRQAGRKATHRRLLATLAQALRQRKQSVSAADLIAVESTARALAALRGQEDVWRMDLLDAVTAAMVKDESRAESPHPMLLAVHELLRGQRRGRLAEGTIVPPLVEDIRAQLEAMTLQPQMRPSEITLNLLNRDELERSRLLHRLRVLGIPGFELLGGTDFAARDDLSQPAQAWRVRWCPEQDAQIIESARYGATLADAAQQRLAERASAIERDAAKAAVIMLDAALANIESLSTPLHNRMTELIRQDGDFFGVTAALGHLLYLFRYDQVLRAGIQADMAAMLVEAFNRGVWLLEALGQVAGRDADITAGISALVETFERCGRDLRLDSQEFHDVLGRTAADRQLPPLLRGAAIGALWSMQAPGAPCLETVLRQFADPQRLGDFLTGLFALARETLQRQQSLLLAINSVVTQYDTRQFLAALPSLRLAFTYFTPREKHYLAQTMRDGLTRQKAGADPAVNGAAGAGARPAETLAALEVSVEHAAAVMQFEARILELAGKFGIRGGNHG